jgi:hypothetical protein
VETNTTPGQATVRVRRLGSSHGDIATALALACAQFKQPPQRARIYNPNRLAQVNNITLRDPFDLALAGSPRMTGRVLP